jgi:hypothetical protein
MAPGSVLVQRRFLVWPIMTGTALANQTQTVPKIVSAARAWYFGARAGVAEWQTLRT